jgi:deoxycytidine triphosphate deaminase
MPLSDLLAQTIEEAKARFLRYESFDPFPDIMPSLLNSADIADYVIKTSLLYPFYEVDLKPASYAIRLKGKYVFFDESGKKNEGIIDENTPEFILLPNSIAFVTLEPYIQLPHYLATRFNLKINHIYKGLLLGTGPLVDPGFVGYLSIPLHNLTSNPYTLRYDDTLIWMEFTKVSPNCLWDRNINPIERQGEIKLFKENKRNKTVDQYIADAEPNRAIQSSIPKGHRDALQAAEAARTSANASEISAKRANFINYALFITGFIGLTTMVNNILTVHDQTTKYLKDSGATEQQLRERIHENEIKLQELEEKLKGYGLEKKDIVKKKVNSQP